MNVRNERRLHVVLLVAALAAGGASACHKNRGSSSQGSSSAGGETGADAGTSGGSGSSWDRPDAGAGSTRPPADEEEQGAGSTGAADAGVATSGAGATPSGDAGASANPWGATREQECAEPTRPGMSASARSAFQDGLAAASRNDVATAQARFQTALQQDRNAYRAAYNLGVLADRQGQENQALDYYRQALRIQPDYEQAVDGIVSILLRRSSVTEAVNLVAPLAQQYRSNKRLQAIYARALTAAGRYDDAWNAARRALQCDERYVPALVALVRTSLAQGRQELAESILEQALRIDGNDAEAHFLKGTILRDQPGRLREALDEFRKAVDLRPDYVDARMALGIQLLAGGNYPDAVAQFQAARDLAPNLVAVHLNLGDALRSTKQWQQAKAELDQALRLNPNLAEAHYNLGLMYQTAGPEFPGMDDLQSAQKAVEEFTAYRNLMGPRLPRDDASEQYLAQLNKTIERIQRRRQREARAAQENADRSTRDADGGTPSQ